jgi:hypothetical protein
MILTALGCAPGRIDQLIETIDVGNEEPFHSCHQAGFRRLTTK